ncbi:MAG: hypothetical protein ABI406_16685 [Ktedonobacteraceae bacterium]
MLSEQPVPGTRRMVADAHYLATQVGTPMLTQGGNALDTAITVNTIMDNSRTYIFERAIDPYCDGLAPGW